MLPSPPAEFDTRARSKRKFGDVTAEEARDTSFQLVNLADDSCLNFEPICKILRAHLPLSWLAAAHPTDIIASGSLLRGSISRITAWEYSALVARLLPNGSLYALERIEEECYVLHALQPFITTKWITDASMGIFPQVNMQMMLHYLPVSTPCDTHQANPRRTLSISSDSDLKIAKNRKGAAARLSILGQYTKQESLPASPVSADIHVKVGPAETDPEDISAVVTVHENASARIDGESGEFEKVIQESLIPPVDMLSADYLRQRYLETLYTTKSPLSYYSKGPLSRARARARAPDASISLGELATFYRDGLLPAKKLDLKYRQSIREAINQALQDSMPDAEVPRKSKKRTKLGKDGLWSVEAKYIAKWWRETQNNHTSTMVLEAQIGQAISSLRMRETQMQILLILEILSIESKQNVPTPASAPEALPNSEVKIESIERGNEMTEKPQKSAKRRTVETDLELLADKLCIWHSIGLEDTVISGTSAPRPDGDDAQSHSKDSLRNFCTEVLIPFYSSKLPLICKSLCRTLAGPELYDRAAKATRLKDDQSKSITPGAVLLRRPPSRSGTLDRVFSDEGLRHPSPPVLLRSATLPPIPLMRREKSETPNRQLNRQTSMSFTSREVDLVADANVTAIKKRKLDMVALQKQELASAIQALKKPNRQISATSYMDDVEARKQKLQKPVLIIATPRTHRKKTLTDPESVAVSELSFVPSSGVKRKTITAMSVGAPCSQKKKAVLAALQATPSRTSLKKAFDLQSLSGFEHSAIPSTPMLEKDSFVFATPTKQNPATVIHTPVKQAKPVADAKRDDFDLPDMALKVMDRVMKKPVSRPNDSVYAQLGWEDDLLSDL